MINKRVIEVSGDWRLMWTQGPRPDAHEPAAQYRVEVKEGGEEWEFAKDFYDGSYMVFWLQEVALGVSSKLVKRAENLPHDPAEYAQEAAKLPKEEKSARWHRFPDDHGPQEAKPEKVDWRADYLGEENPAYRMQNDSYHGVQVHVGDWRVIVSPNGRRYYLQKRQPAGTWREVKYRKLRSSLIEVMPEGVPGALIAQAAALPEVSCDVVRPWAAAQEARAERLRRANPAADDCLTLVARDGALRLIVSPGRSQYWLQVLSLAEGRWRRRRACANASEVRRAVVQTQEPWPKVGGFAFKSDKLAAAALTLPESPADWKEPEGEKAAR